MALIFNPVMILETRSIGGPTFDNNDPWPHMIYIELEQMGVLKKPLVYFAKNEMNDKGNGGMAWNRSSDGGKRFAEPRDSAILFRNIALNINFSSKLISEDYLGKYEILAHELAHILMDAAHIETDGDIMSEFTDRRTNKILSSQCELIQNNFL